MKIIPIYPKKILNQPYFKGIMTGMIMMGGMMMVICIDRLTGIIILVFGLILYIYQSSDDYNFI